MKFKKGDRVVIVDYPFRDLEGKVGTVLTYDNEPLDFLVGIEFDDYIGGHDCRNSGKWGHCWWMQEYQCELLGESLESYESDNNYYNGKVVCVEDGMNLVKVGRLFNVVNGVAKYKDVLLTKTPITSIDDLNSRFGFVKFIEVIE